MNFRVALIAALALGPCSSLFAAPLRSVASLQSITVYETTASTLGTTFAVNSTELTTRRAGSLTDANSDFSYFTNEDYDVFYSDADGTFNLDGGYLTIEAVWRDNTPGQGATYGSMNINEVRLNYAGGASAFGDFVTAAVPGSNCNTGLLTHCINGSGALAVDHDLNTMPRFGATSLVDAGERMKLTIGFNGISTAAVPVPAAGWLFATGMGALRMVSRRRAKPA